MIVEVEVDGARHELIPLSDAARWNAALKGVRHAFAHTWEHCRAFSLSSRFPTYLYHYQYRSSRVVCPLSTRSFEGECDIFTPYGFGGMAASGPIPDFAAQWRLFAGTQGWVCAYLQSNPLVEDPLSGADISQSLNEIFVLDLQDSDEVLLGRMSRGRRGQICGEASRRFDFRVGGPEAVEFLIEHAGPFFAGRDASPIYQFVPATWEALLTAPQVFSITAWRDGLPQAVGVFGRGGDIGDFLINVSIPSGRSASAVLYWNGIKRLRELGCNTVNLGGGIRPNDDVATFKRRLGARALPLAAHRQVFRKRVFERLCRQAAVPVEAPDTYFPPYYSSVSSA